MAHLRWLVIGLALTIALPAAAQFGGIKVNVGGKNFGPAAANKTLKSLDGQLSNGFKALPQSYGKDPAREETGLNKAAGIAAQVKEKMSADLKLGGSNYTKVEKRIGELEAAVAKGRLQNAASSARQVILNKNRAWIPATEAELGAFDKTVRTLETDHKDPKTVAFWQGEAKKLRTDQKRIAEEGATKAAKAASKAKEKELSGARGAISAIDIRIVEVMKAAAAPIGAADLAAYDAEMAKIAAIHPPAVLRYESNKRQFLIYNGWHGGGPSEIATIMKGTLATGGTSEGKRLSIKFTAEEGYCYSMLTRWKVWTSGEKINGFTWRGKGGNSHLQRYAVNNGRAPGMRTRGLCATKKTAITAEAELKFAGTRNALEYAVVAWPKASFPIEEAAYLAAWKGDVCDTAAWQRRWLDPIPGSVVYKGREPFIISSPDRAGQSWMTMINVVGRDSVRAKKEDVLSQPPKAAAFKTQLSMPSCPSVDSAESKLSKKLAKCSLKVREKYNELYDRARKAKENARTPGGWRSAKARLAGLGDKKDREWDSKCKPTRKKIEKNFEKAYNAIVDGYADGPPPVFVDRAKRLVDEN